MTSKNRKAKTAERPHCSTRGTAGEKPGGATPPMDNNNSVKLDRLPLVPELDANIQRHLGQKLKASYDDLIRQPVPDKFRELLEELERKEKPK
jgi:hypothetical protein